MAESPFASWTIMDEEGEKSNIEVRIAPYTVVNVLVILPALNAFKAALQKISGGTVVSHKYAMYNTTYPAIPPTDENFMRGRKWVIPYVSKTDGRKYDMSIPCARVLTTTSEALKDKKGFAIKTHPSWVTFIDDLKQVGRTVYGHDIEVLRPYLQHRKS